MLKYLWLPFAFLFLSLGLTTLGVYLTQQYFEHEHGELIDAGPPEKVYLVDLPYLTWGPIAFAAGSTGLISSMVYVTYKVKKWRKGLAGPITAHFEQYKIMKT